MPLKIGKEKNAGYLKRRVEDISGIKIDGCLQCKKCSCGCPVTSSSSSSPSEIIKLLQLGAGDELLNSDIIWVCASCATCFSRCPMKIDMMAVMDALRILAVERKAVIPEANAPLMNRALLKTIRIFGRTYDLGAMLLYKAGTSTYWNDMEKIPTLLKKRKIAILPPHGADKKTVRKIFNKTNEIKDNG